MFGICQIIKLHPPKLQFNTEVTELKSRKLMQSRHN